MKKFLSVILVAALLLACVPMLPLPASAAEYTEGGYIYTVSNGKAKITDYTGVGGAITIPSTLGGYPVTGIGNEAFRGSGLTRVIIPNSVTYIGYAAFYCCGLTEITIPDSVTSISQMAFDGCNKLTTVTIGNSVTYIGDGVFAWCTSLTSVTIPEGVTSIGQNVFKECTSLRSVTIPEGVTNIDWDAFYGCDSLTDVYYGGTQTQWNAISIDDGNKDLTSATIHYSHIHDYTLVPPTIVESTCTTNGYAEYTCIYGETYRETLPFADHTVGSDSVVTPPTCTKGGYTTSTCTRCGAEVKTDYVDALGHDYTGTVTVIDPTCIEGGYTTTDCTRCDSVQKTNPTDALGHKMVVVPAVPATCTKTGLAAGSVCERCDMVGVAQRETAPNGIHEYADGVCTGCDDICDIGDANGDKAINTQDTLLIMKHLAGWDVEIDLEMADVNGDGVINTKDSLLLMKYLAGYGVILG